MRISSRLSSRSAWDTTGPSTPRLVDARVGASGPYMTQSIRSSALSPRPSSSECRTEDRLVVVSSMALSTSALSWVRLVAGATWGRCWPRSRGAEPEEMDDRRERGFDGDGDVNLEDSGRMWRSSSDEPLSGSRGRSLPSVLSKSVFASIKY